MKPILALLRTTWWLWIVFFGSSALLIELVDPVFWITVPIYLVTLLYFAYIRYDDQGKRRG